jgi:hypothetical protein
MRNTLPKYYTFLLGHPVYLLVLLYCHRNNMLIITLSKCTPFREMLDQLKLILKCTVSPSSLLWRTWPGSKNWMYVLVSSSDNLIPSSAGLKRQAGQGGSTAHAAPKDFSRLQKHRLLTSLRQKMHYYPNKVNVFGRGITLPGRAELNQALPEPCRRQLYAVFQAQILNYLIRTIHFSPVSYNPV